MPTIGSDDVDDQLSAHRFGNHLPTIKRPRRAAGFEILKSPNGATDGFGDGLQRQPALLTEMTDALSKAISEFTHRQNPATPNGICQALNALGQDLARKIRQNIAVPSFDPVVVASRIDVALNELQAVHGSLENVAKLFGVKRNTLKNWRGRGGAGPQQGTPFWAIARLVELTPHTFEWFLGGDDNPDERQKLQEIRDMLNLVLAHMDIEIPAHVVSVELTANR